jgi:hypothetical protein
MITVLLNQANGNGTAVGLSNREGSQQAATTLLFQGTWDSATAKLQISGDSGTTWIDIADASATANTAFNITASKGFSYRGVVSGGGGSESITIYWGQ